MSTKGENKGNTKVEEMETYKKRVEELKGFELQINKEWDDAHIYEKDAKVDGNPHDGYMATFPYPYMNGRLHFGHLFTITKAETATRYQQMKGRDALFPFSFHCTGTPIQASALKLKRELETGVEVVASGNVKNKLAAKTIQGASQSEILESNGIPKEDIPKFVDPKHWVEYFPMKGMEDLKRYGINADFRRSFITTSINPYYDKFVRWQFNLLKKFDLVKFGKRPTICTYSDAQPCMDHDRSEGEAVTPQEYTLIKLKLVDPKSIDERFDKDTYLLAATLRPETMIGQTNYWIKPGVEYEVNTKNNEYLICGTRSSKNMLAQELIDNKEPLFTVKSDLFLGKECEFVLLDHPIKGFPLEDINMNKGTGIVTSVPSDAPADYQGLEDLKKDTKLREKYGIQKEWVDEIKVIEIIDTPTYGSFCAQAILKQLMADKIKRTKQERLEVAKDIAYKEGFYKGVMIKGKFTGRKVQEAKEEMKKELCDANWAITYYEPMDRVVARTDEECVVMFLDQWYLAYGQAEWKEKVKKHFEAHVETFNPITRDKFRSVFEWLGEWACSRQFGLGTQLPFDETYVIDSLSDSTIYMAYYTISHLMQGDLYGSKPGILGISSDVLDDSFFECVFRNGPKPDYITQEQYDTLKREFGYWYPNDLRVSGKDLIPNHLTMFLYNHVAIFGEENCPLGIRANGFLKLNNNKMSKSKGNFITLIDGVEKYSSTCVRVAMADAGDSVNDANFDELVAISAVSRLYSIISLIKNGDADTRDTLDGFDDELFNAQLSKAIIEADNHYKATNYKLALKAAFFDLPNDWGTYVANCGKSGVCKELKDRYINVFLHLMTPIIPHFTEYVWRHILNNNDFIVRRRFPEVSSYNPQIYFIERLLSKTNDQVGFAVKSVRKIIKQMDSCAIYIATSFTEVQKKCLNLIKKFVVDGKVDEKEILASVKSDPDFKGLKPNDYMAFLRFYIQSTNEFGTFLLEENPTIDQEEIININIKVIKRMLANTMIEKIHIFIVDKDTDKPFYDKDVAQKSLVYLPSAKVFNSTK